MSAVIVAPEPPMLDSVAPLVSMAVQTIPVEFRDAMRRMARLVAAQAWQDGHRAATLEAQQDRQ